jgi:hypothetical protein
MRTFYAARVPLLAAPAVMCFLVLAGPLTAAQPSGQDSIDVVGHLALPGVTVSAIQSSTHWARTLLELTDDQHRILTVVDVTDPAHPKEVKTVTLPAQPGNTDVEAMTGNTALLTENAQAAKAPEAVSIVNFNDPSHPAIVRKFDSVSAIRKELGGTIYLTNTDGLWILRQNEAPDKNLEASYRDYILYGSR